MNKKELIEGKSPELINTYYEMIYQSTDIIHELCIIIIQYTLEPFVRNKPSCCEILNLPSYINCIAVGHGVLAILLDQLCPNGIDATLMVYTIGSWVKK